MMATLQMSDSSEDLDVNEKSAFMFCITRLILFLQIFRICYWIGRLQTRKNYNLSEASTHTFLSKCSTHVSYFDILFPRTFPNWGKTNEVYLTQVLRQRYSDSKLR